MRRCTAFAAVFLTLSQMASAQNILNNSGFEYGLMCYLNNIWSVTDVFGSGDYRLKLSTNAHSGNYALEISCPGTDCLKAAAFSAKIPTALNQDYILKVWTKCAPGGATAVYIPNASTGDVFQWLTCDNTWAQNTILFRTNATDKDFFYYLFSYYGTTSLFDDVVLTYGDGSAPAASTAHAGVRNLSLSSKALSVDGLPYLALGFFDVPYDELPLAKASGANTIFALSGQPPAACFNTTQTEYVDRAYELGLNFVPDSSTTARLGEAGAMAAATQKFAPHQANIAWMLADEPDQTFVPFWYMDPAVFVTQANAAKTKTTLPIIADFQRAAWSVPTDVAPYTPGVDFFMAEPYGADFRPLSYAVNMFRSFPPARAMWIAQDATEANLIVPKAYWAVAEGVTGIAYFTWSDFQGQPAKLTAALQVFAELGQLKSVIFSENIDSLVTAPPGVKVAARYNNGSAYLMAANNPEAQNLAAAFQMAGLVAGQQIQVMFENRNLTATAGGFTDSFAGVARHVYVVKAPLAALAGSLQTKSGPDNARAWRVQITNTGLGVLTAAKITSASLVYSGGKTCAPTVASSLPLAIGDIAHGASGAGDLVLNFTGCDTTSKFTVNIGLAANGITGAIVRNNERK